jgi:hypothetical protein
MHPLDHQLDTADAESHKQAEVAGCWLLGAVVVTAIVLLGLATYDHIRTTEAAIAAGLVQDRQGHWVRPQTLPVQTTAREGQSLPVPNPAELP